MMLLCMIMGVKGTIYPNMYYYIANYNFTASKWLAFISWWFFMLVTFCLIKIVDLLKERKKRFLSSYYEMYNAIVRMRNNLML